MMLWNLVAVAATTIELHGAGTTNPSKFFWKTMDLFEERARVPLYMTYRAVGSSTGQKEFVGADNAYKPYNHFGSGDIPMSADRYQDLKDNGGDNAGNVVHIPFVMGAIAIFHSVEGLTEANPIHLDGCTLAKVFSRQITMWDDQAIKDLNPDLPAGVLDGKAINVVHRVKGSSSTAGTTEYLEKTCPGSWSLGSGSTIPWPEDTLDGQGSDGVAATIESTPNTIGYLDAGHGHALGFGEIALQNLNGNYLTSKQANIGAAGTQALAAPSVIPDDPSADWSGVNLYDLAGDDTWPITMFSYFYIQKDLSTMEKETAGLLKAFIDYTLSPEGQAGLEDFAFTGVAQEVLEYNTKTLGDVTWPADMPEFEFELKSDTQVGAGAGKYMLSGKRMTYADYHRGLMERDIEDLQAKVAVLEERLLAKAPIQLHGAGTTNPSKFIWKTMDLFEERAKRPLYMTYRAVGSSTGQMEFVGAANDNKPFNDFGAGDIPMKQSNYQAVKDGGGSVVQIPFVMGAIAIFHSVEGATDANPIHLDGCTLAKVFSRQITMWDDKAIKDLNPDLPASVLAGKKINVVHRVHGSSSTAGTTEYLEKTCPGSWKLGSGSTITWPDDTLDGQGSDGVATTIESTPNTIGYLDAGHGHALGFGEIALQNLNGNYLTSKQADIGAAGTQALAPPSVIPTDPSEDWSGVNLYDLAGADTWPITMFSYFYIQQDMSAADPQTAGLLKAFIEYTLSPEGQAGLEDFAFTGVAPKVIEYNSQTLSSVKWPKGMTNFEFELADTTRKGDGAKVNVLSGKRVTYADYARGLIERDIEELHDLVAKANHASRIEILENVVDDLQAGGAAAPAKSADADDDSGSNSWLPLTLSIIALIVSIVANVLIQKKR